MLTAELLKVGNSEGWKSSASVLMPQEISVLKMDLFYLQLKALFESMIVLDLYHEVGYMA